MHTSKVTLAIIAAMTSTVIAAPHRIASRNVESRGDYDRTRKIDSYKPDVEDYDRRRPSQGEYEMGVKGRYNKDQRVVDDDSYKPQPIKPKSKDYVGKKADDYADGKTNYDGKQETQNKDGYYN